MSDAGIGGFVFCTVFPFGLEPSAKLCYHDGPELAIF